MNGIKTRGLAVFIAVAMPWSLCSEVSARERQLVAGGGASTTVVTEFFNRFGAQPEAIDYIFIVPDTSVRHAGGIKNTDKYLFGRTCRPLGEEEKSRNKAEIFLAKIPVTFVAGSNAGVESVTVKNLEDVYDGSITNWRDLGGNDAQIFLVGRDKKESVYSLLQRDLPFMRDASFHTVMEKDHQVVSFMESSKGQNALSFGTRPSFSAPPVGCPGIQFGGLCWAGL